MSWRTGPGLDVVGYRVWREVGGQRTLLTPGLVAGPVMQSRASALAGRSYAWEDLASGRRRALLARVAPHQRQDDLGRRHGGAGQGRRSCLGGRRPRWALLRRAASPAVPRGPQQAALTIAVGGDRSEPVALAGRAAAKLAVRAEGVYRVPAESLFAAGISAGASVADAPALPGRTSGSDGRPGRGRRASPGGRCGGVLRDRQRHPLHRHRGVLAGQWPGRGAVTCHGRRPARRAPSPRPTSRLASSGSGWCGSARSRTETPRSSSARRCSARPAPTSSRSTNSTPRPMGRSLEVALVGVTEGPHAVSVSVNGLGGGERHLRRADPGRGDPSLPPGLLVEGDTQVVLTSSGATDIRLEDHVRLVYPRRTARATGALVFSLPGGTTASLSGFAAASARVLDVTDPTRAGAVWRWSTTGRAARPSRRRERRATTPGVPPRRRALQPASVTANTPSALHAESAGADLVVVGPADLLAALGPLVAAAPGGGAPGADRRHRGPARRVRLRRQERPGASRLSPAGGHAVDGPPALRPPRRRRPPTTRATTSASAGDRMSSADGADRLHGGGLRPLVRRLPRRRVDGGRPAPGAHRGRGSRCWCRRSSDGSPPGRTPRSCWWPRRAGTSDFQGHLQEVASRLPSAALQWIVRGTDSDAALHDQLLAQAAARPGGGRLRRPRRGDVLGGQPPRRRRRARCSPAAGRPASTSTPPATPASSRTRAGRASPWRRCSPTAVAPGARGPAPGGAIPPDHPALNAALVDALVNKGQTLGEATRAALAATDGHHGRPGHAGPPRRPERPPHPGEEPRPDGIPTPPAPKTGCGAVDGPAGLLPLAPRRRLAARAARPSRCQPLGRSLAPSRSRRRSRGRSLAPSRGLPGSGSA